MVTSTFSDVHRYNFAVVAPTPKPRPKSAKPPRTDATTGAKHNSAPYVEPPPLELALKFPVEVWISCGEDFVKPQSMSRDEFSGHV